MAAKKTRKPCPHKWINKQTVQEVRDHGEAYWGPLTDAKTQKGTMNKAFLAEASCRGLKIDVHRQSGYEPELHLVPIKGRRVPYPW